jgi:glycosyltransferase involved in cell wall biosynthesis
MKVAFVVTHPIQYYVPLFRALSFANKFELKVFYTWGETSLQKYDPAYNKIIKWDIPLLDGYDYEFLHNTSADPGTHHFKGIINPDVLNKINEYSPDKIVIYGWNYDSHLKVLKYFKNKVPIYFRGDSHLINNKLSIRTIIRKVYLSYIYRHIDFAIAVGVNNKKYYKWAGLKNKQILFAPHAIDNKKFEITDSKKVSSIRTDLNIPDDYTIFLYCGSFEDRKRVSDLILAKSKLSNEKCSLVIVGAGKNDTFLFDLANQQNDKNIHFIGFVNQSELPSYYALSDVFVLPSEIETWGLVINEAMAAGLAIIASDKVGAADDLVTNNGFQYKCGSISDLLEKMLKLINDRKLLESFKNQSKINISNWSMDAQVNCFIRILS